MSSACEGIILESWLTLRIVLTKVGGFVHAGSALAFSRRKF